MPRNAGEVYQLPAGATAVSGQVISATNYNTTIQDLAAEQIDARPISAGGTGATTASGARTNLGIDTLLADKIDADATDIAQSQITDLTTDLNTITQNVATVTSDLASFETSTQTALSATGFPSGTKMLFNQTAAPTGWTKDTAQNDKALRVVSGTVGSGGTNALSSATLTATGTISTSISGSVAGHSLTTSQIPSHTHSFSSSVSIPAGGSGLTDTNNTGVTNITSYNSSTYNFSGTTGSAGSGSAHSHSASGLTASSTFTGTAANLDLAYVDVIIAAKD